MKKEELIKQVCEKDEMMGFFGTSLDFWQCFAVRIQNAYYIQSIFTLGNEDKNLSDANLSQLLTSCDNDSQRFHKIIDIFKRANEIIKALDIKYAFQNEENPFNGELSRKIVMKLLCA